MTLGIIMFIILLQPGGIWAMYESLIDVRVAVQKESSVPEPILILQPLTPSRLAWSRRPMINAVITPGEPTASWVPTAQERPPLNLITGHLNPIGRIMIQGRDSTGLPPRQITARPGAFVSDSAALYGVERVCNVLLSPPRKPARVSAWAPPSSAVDE